MQGRYSVFFLITKEMMNRAQITRLIHRTVQPKNDIFLNFNFLSNTGNLKPGSYSLL